MPPVQFPAFLWRVIASHMITYALVGFAAFTVFDYRTLYAETELRHLMRPTTSAWVAAGPALQVLRGVLFAAVLWPLRERLLVARGGAWVLFGLMLGLAILGTAGPAPGSLEGVWFTTLPITIQLLGLPEVLVQTAAFSFTLVAWCHHPRRGFDIAAAIGVALVVAMAGLGVLAALGQLPSG